MTKRPDSVRLRRKVAKLRRPATLKPRHGTSLGNVLDKLAKAFTPEPYNEKEAAVDALGGREACRHGQWPHQKAICALCAAEAATKVLSKFLEKTP